MALNPPSGFRLGDWLRALSAFVSVLVTPPIGELPGGSFAVRPDRLECPGGASASLSTPRPRRIPWDLLYPSMAEMPSRSRQCRRICRPLLCRVHTANDLYQRRKPVH